IESKEDILNANTLRIKIRCSRGMRLTKNKKPFRQREKTDGIRDNPTNATEHKHTHTNPKADQNTGSEIHLPSTSRRPARQQPAMTGAGPSDDDLQAVDQMAWLFV
ncbi:hypothetical protein L9F63_006596, partial [Diploptera punctata]